MTVTKQSLSACTSILVGKKASLDGSVYIGRNEDAKSAWPKHMCVHPRQEFTSEQVFTSKDNGFSMPLPKVAYKYTATPEWTDEFGLFEEDGINEFGVAMSATESAYANSEVLSCDPLVANGIGEEAMVTVVLPYIKNAREGVLRLGQIVSEYGASEANGILFADDQEAWYLEIGSGHHWVAQRIPDDAYAVVANQLAIEEIDFADTKNFLTSTGIQAFVEANQLNPSLDGTFNFRKIFGTQTLSDQIYSTPRVWYGQKYLTPSVEQDPMSLELPFIRKPDRKLGLDDLSYVLGSHYQNTPYDPLNSKDPLLKKKFRPISLAKTQESHILQLRSDLSQDIKGIHWLALGVTAQSVFVPFFAGANDVHPAYKVGKATYDSTSAYWVYKQAGILVDAHYQAFAKELSDLQTELTVSFKTAVRKVVAAVKAGEFDGDLADFLTTESIKLQDLGLKKYQALSASLITQATDMSPLNFKTDANL